MHMHNVNIPILSISLSVYVCQSHASTVSKRLHIINLFLACGIPPL